MDQLRRDINILYLVDMLADIYAFVREAEPLRRIESHRDIMACLAQQTIDCGYFISAYCSDRFRRSSNFRWVHPIYLVFLLSPIHSSHSRD